MSPAQALIALAFGGLSLAVAIVCSARLFAERRTRRALQDRVKSLNGCLRAKPDGIGAESREALSNYFIALNAEIEKHIQQFDGVHTTSSSSFVLASEEAKRTRLVDRKDRFIRYCEALLEANVRIDMIVRTLRADRVLVEQLLERLSSRQWDFAMGTLELEAIDNVIKDLGREAVDDLICELKVKRVRAEFDHVTKFREAMIEAEERIRDRTAPNPMVAKAARSLGED
jgi:hypothetical protein